MAEHLNRQQRAADRTNNGVDRVPDGIHPRNFISKELEEIEKTSDCNYPRVAEDLERLILWRQRDPVKMDGQSGDKNRQVKVDAGETSQAERDGKKVEFLHGAIIRRS